MQYHTEITLKLPRSEVTALFIDPENLGNWQPELLGRKSLEGEAGVEGSRSELRYSMGRKECRMVETVIRNELPDSWDATYEADGVWNKVHNRFEAIDTETTKWVQENEFRFRGFMKLFGLFGKGMFRKQTEKYMVYFKTFAEKKRESETPA